MKIVFGLSCLAVLVMVPSCAGVLYDDPGADCSQPATTGSLYVTSTPSGAAIVLDGTATGNTTPHRLENLSPGTHTVLVSLEGYQDAQVEFDVEAGVHRSHHFELVSEGAAASAALAPQAY